MCDVGEDEKYPASLSGGTTILDSTASSGNTIDYHILGVYIAPFNFNLLLTPDCSQAMWRSCAVMIDGFFINGPLLHYAYEALEDYMPAGESVRSAIMQVCARAAFLYWYRRKESKSDFSSGTKFPLCGRNSTCPWAQATNRSCFPRAAVVITLGSVFLSGPARDDLVDATCDVDVWRYVCRALELQSTSVKQNSYRPFGLPPYYV